MSHGDPMDLVATGCCPKRMGSWVGVEFWRWFGVLGGVGVLPHGSLTHRTLPHSVVRDPIGAPNHPMVLVTPPA